MYYPRGNMNLSLLTKITKQLPSETVAVSFFRGEPLLHPQFNEAIRILGKFKKVQLATNGDYLTTPKQKAILDSCTFISLSLHEFLKPEATSWTGFLFDCQKNGVETQVSILDKLVDPKHHDAFVNDWKQHVDRVRVYASHSGNGFGNMNNKIVNSTCCKPFTEMIVYWDGHVGLCNHDWNLSFPLGDLNVKSVSQVWRGANYDGVRDLHNIGLRRSVPTCEFCSFENKKVYGELIKNRENLHPKQAQHI